MALVQTPMHAHMARPMHSEAARDAIFEEAMKDQQAIDKVFSKPTLAATEDLEHAYELLRKWSDGAEQRYGPDTMLFLRGRGIAQQGVTSRRKAELQRILGLRRQSAEQKNSEPRPPPTEMPTPAQVHAPSPQQQRPPSAQSVPPPSQPHGDRPTIRPPLYQAPDRARDD
ncbi:MAG: hypothetical protein LQ340_008115, partial [Diploschistes diacapsis]